MVVVGFSGGCGHGNEDMVRGVVFIVLRGS